MHNLIDAEVDTYPLDLYSGNPKITIFKKRYLERPTHFNKWSYVYDFGTSKNLCISDMYQKNIHIYSNLSLIITFNESLDIKTAFSCLYNVYFRIGSLVAMCLDGSSIYEILRLNYQCIKKIKKVLKHTNQLIIPLQTFVTHEDSFITASHTVEIKYEIAPGYQMKNTSVGLTCVYLTSSEEIRYRFCSEEYMANRYYVEKHRIINDTKITIPVMLPIKTIIVIPKNKNNRMDIGIEFRKFIRSTDNHFADDIDYQSNNYYLNLLCEQSTNNIPTGKLFPTNKNLHIDIKAVNPDEITIIYCCHDYLRIGPEYVAFGGLLVKRVNENHYPLTKVSENKFIEGYWFPSDPSDYDYDVSYPIPVPTVEPVSIEFMAKLELLTKTVATENAYHGPSPCRLCDGGNG